MVQARVHKQTDQIRQRAGNIQRRSQDLLDGQMERCSPAGAAGQTAVQGTAEGRAKPQTTGAVVDFGGVRKQAGLRAAIKELPDEKDRNKP